MLLCGAVVAAAVSGAPNPGPRAADPPTLPVVDAVRIAEAFRIADDFADNLWEGWSEAPRALLLVTREKEFLVHHPSPTDDFVSVGYDSIVGSDVYVRDRVHDPMLQATFPAVGGVPTIVIGQTKRVQASHSTRWVLTVLHEHFHQWQQSRPDYYPGVEGLGLAKGDTSGMWMLNYPFPYAADSVATAFEAMCRTLAGVVRHTEPVEAYLAAREGFRASIGEDDNRYFAFQLWQEGIARYTELEIARRVSVSYRATARFRHLPDVVAFDVVADEIADNIVDQLERVRLAEAERVAFYHVGAAEGIILDRTAPGWRGRYMQDRFDTTPFFPDESD